MSSDTESDDFWAPDGLNAEDGYAKLRAGAINNDVNLIREAIASGININALFPDQEDGVAALHEAASRGNVEALRALLDHGAKVNVRGREAGNQFEDRTPLYCAAEKCQALAVRTLLEAGADLKALGPYDDTAFGAVLRPLVQRASFGEKVQIDQRHIETINAFIEFGTDVSSRDDSNGVTLVEQAAILGDPKLFQHLLDHGISLAGALKVAAKRPGGLGTVQYLLSIGLKDSTGQALLAAAQNNCLDIARCLLSRQNIAIAAASGALHSAAFNGHIEMVKLLLEHGVPIEASTTDGITPLLAACTSNRPIPDMLQFLLDHDASVNSSVLDSPPKSLYIKGDTPLHVTARWSFPAHVSTLTRAGANLNARNSDASTPLHLIARNFNNGWPMVAEGEDPRLEALRLFVEAGPDVKALDASGNTAMLLLATNVRPGRRDKVVQAAEVLISHGARDIQHLATRVRDKDLELAERLINLPL